MQVFDTHAHVYPSRYLDQLEAIGVPADTTEVARNMQADNTPDDMGARLRMMDAAGVDVQVLSVTPQLPMVDDPVAAQEACRAINDEYADIVRARPDRFYAYGAAPLPHADPSVAAVGYCLDELGFVGMACTTITGNQRYLSDPAFDPFFAELDRRAAVLYIHPSGCGAMSPMINEQKLQWVVGAPIEDSLAVLHLLKADVPRRFPNIQWHIAHLGGGLAFLAQRIEDNYEDWHAFDSDPLRSIRRMWFDAANFHGPSLRLVLDTFDPKRVMCGSDYPYFRNEKYTRAVEYIRAAGLTPEQVADVLGNNAAALYG